MLRLYELRKHNGLLVALSQDIAAKTTLPRGVVFAIIKP